MPSNASIVLQQLGLASAPAMTSTAATLGVAGVLRATSSMVPKEGTPRMRNPASPAQREQRAETVQRKHAENEDEHAERMQGLAAKLEARLSRAEARKKMF